MYPEEELALRDIADAAGRGDHNEVWAVVERLEEVFVRRLLAATLLAKFRPK